MGLEYKTENWEKVVQFFEQDNDADPETPSHSIYQVVKDGVLAGYSISDWSGPLAERGVPELISAVRIGDTASPRGTFPFMYVLLKDRPGRVQVYWSGGNLYRMREFCRMYRIPVAFRAGHTVHAIQKWWHETWDKRYQASYP